LRILHTVKHHVVYYGVVFNQFAGCLESVTFMLMTSGFRLYMTCSYSTPVSVMFIKMSLAGSIGRLMRRQNKIWAVITKAKFSVLTSTFLIKDYIISQWFDHDSYLSHRRRNCSGFVNHGQRCV